MLQRASQQTIGSDATGSSATATLQLEINFVNPASHQEPACAGSGTRERRRPPIDQRRHRRRLTSRSLAGGGLPPRRHTSSTKLCTQSCTHRIGETQGDAVLHCWHIGLVWQSRCQLSALSLLHIAVACTCARQRTGCCSAPRPVHRPQTHIHHTTTTAVTVPTTTIAPWGASAAAGPATASPRRYRLQHEQYRPGSVAGPMDIASTLTCAALRPPAWPRATGPHRHVESAPHTGVGHPCLLNHLHRTFFFLFLM